MSYTKQNLIYNISRSNKGGIVMTRKDNLTTMVNYIEENLKENLTIDIIADQIGYSKYYLNRLFSIYTGISIMDYVRKRRLNASMAELITDKRIVDIALDYNYSSERSFSRAFTKEFGESPSHYRHNILPYRDKIKLFDLNLNLNFETLSRPLHPDLDKNIMKKGVSEIMKFLSDVSYVSLTSMTVLSGTIFGSDPEEEVINLMHEFAKENHITSLREFGFDVPIESEKPNEEYRGYEFWLSISDDDLNKLSEKTSDSRIIKFKDNNVTIKNIPSYRYASLRITDPFTEPFIRIPAGWKALVGWLEKNEVCHNNEVDTFDGYCLEEVIEKEGKTSMDIFIPVEKL